MPDADDLDVRLEWPADGGARAGNGPTSRAAPRSAPPVGEGGPAASDDGRIRVRLGESRQVAQLARQVEALRADVEALRAEVAELRDRR